MLDNAVSGAAATCCEMYGFERSESGLTEYV